MKTITSLVLLLTFFISVGTTPTPRNGNPFGFFLAKNKLVWVHTFKDSIDIPTAIQEFEMKDYQSFGDSIIVGDNIIILDPTLANLKGSPIYCRHQMSATTKITFKQDYYKIRITNIKSINPTLGETELELLAIKRNEMKPQFLKFGVPIYHASIINHFSVR